jgi:hypothetical protein
MCSLDGQRKGISAGPATDGVVQPARPGGFPAPDPRGDRRGDGGRQTEGEPPRHGGDATPRAPDLDVTWHDRGDGGEWPSRIEVRRAQLLVWQADAASEDDLDRLVEEGAGRSGLDACSFRRLLSGARLRAATRRLARSPRGDAAPAGGPDGGDARAGDSPTAEAIDQFVRRWVNEIEEGWGPARLGHHHEALVEYVALNYDALRACGLEEVLGAANKALKQHGYDTLTRKKLNREVAAVARDRARTHRVQAKAARAAAAEDGGLPTLATRPRYHARSLSAGEDPADDSGCGIIDREADYKPRTNFELFLEEDHVVEDEAEPQTVFVGRLRTPGREAPFRIRSVDYASNEALRAAVYAAGGSGLWMDLGMDQLRNAVAVISPDRVRRRSTTAFGWTDDGRGYLVPAGLITSGGLQPAGADSELRLDLSDCPQAAHLGMRPLTERELDAARRHVIDDLMPLHHRGVTHALLGMAAAAVLRRFGGVSHRFAGWLAGETGTGKTLLSRLFMSFFGAYPPDEENRFASWAWTVNSIERAGYYFKDTLYLVDDFKTATTWHAQAVRLLQAYGDGAARGRLRSDANFNPARPIRGLLLSTGENVIDQEASTTARTVLVRVEPFGPKDLDRRGRCLRACGVYSSVMAGFIRWLLERGRTGEFADRVRDCEAAFYRQVQGKPNDSRVAANFAVLAAAHAQFAEYLGDGDAWRAEARRFQEGDLPALLGGMIQAVREQRPVQIFWETLCDLVGYGRVRTDDREPGNAPVIGRGPDRFPHPSYFVCTELALAEVQRSLQAQGRPQIPLRAQEIPDLLRKEGKLVDRDGRPIPADGRGGVTGQHRVVPGEAARRGFYVSGAALRRTGDERAGRAAEDRWDDAGSGI